MDRKLFLIITVIIAVFLILPASGLATKDANGNRYIVTLKKPTQNSFLKTSAIQRTTRVGTPNVASQTLEKLADSNILSQSSSTKSVVSKLTDAELQSLESNPDIANIEPDLPVHALLQDSVNIINATNTWNLNYYGQNITGKGVTICVLDTGVNYTHEALGGCTINSTSLTGDITNLSTPIESPHNYSTNTTYTWNITEPGFSNIAVHFVNISTEANYDYVQILDGNDTIVAEYSGSHTNLWSPSVPGDTIKIVLKSDESVTNYGLYIDKDINGTTNTTYDWNSCSKVIGGWDIINGDPDPYDDNGHGTHVSGIIAANKTIQGVAPDANLVMVKVLDSAGKGYGSDIVEGIDWCVNNSQKYNISAISISIGTDLPNVYNSYCDSTYWLYANSINNAVYNNISVFIATGNSNQINNVSLPACIHNATRVSAVDKSDVIANFANRNPAMSILMAPGVNINSTYFNGGYAIESGTSMATPMVAGASALIYQFWKLQNNTGLMPSNIFNAFNSTGKTINDSSTNATYERINVYNALNNLDETPPTINLSISNQTIEWNSTNITINWSVTDNILVNTTELNITYPNGTILFNSTDNSGTLNLIDENLSVIGNYTLSIYAIDSNNNSNTTEENISVTKATPILNLYLNGTEANASIKKYATTNITGISNQAEGNISLFINNTATSTNNSRIELIKQFNNTGTYNISLVFNESEHYSQKQIELTLNVTPKLSILSYQPNSTNSSIYRTQTLIFNQTSNDTDNNTLYYYWYVNGTLNSTSENFTFNSSKYNTGNYSILFIVSNNQTNVSQTWNLEVNEPYPLINYSPSNNYLILRNDSVFTFNQSSTDPLNSSLNYYWYLNGTINTTTENFTITYSDYAPGNYNLTFIASNNVSNSSVHWNVLVSNNTPIEFNSSKSISNLSWTKNNNNSNAIDLSEYFIDPDNNTITYSLINATNITMQVNNSRASFIVQTGYTGTEYVSILANDSDSNASSNNFTLTVLAPAPVSSGGSSGGGSSSSIRGGGASGGELNFYSELIENANGTITVSKDTSAVAINSVEIKLKDIISQLRVRVEQLTPENEPSFVKNFSMAPLKYAALEITHENLNNSNISSVKISFKINKTWITNNDVNLDNITLYRYSGGKWTALNTKYSKSTLTYYEFEATSPGLSTFLIGAQKTATITENKTDTKKLPDVFAQNTSNPTTKQITNTTENKTITKSIPVKNNITTKSVIILVVVLVAIALFIITAVKLHKERPKKDKTPKKKKEKKEKHQKKKTEEKKELKHSHKEYTKASKEAHKSELKTPKKPIAEKHKQFDAKKDMLEQVELNEELKKRILEHRKKRHI